MPLGWGGSLVNTFIASPQRQYSSSDHACMARLGCGCGDPVDHRDLVDLALVPVNEERAGEFKEPRYLRSPLAVRPAWWLLWHGLFFTNAIDSRAHLAATSFESGSIPAIFVPQKEWILRLLTRRCGSRYLGGINEMDFSPRLILRCDWVVKAIAPPNPDRGSVQLILSAALTPTLLRTRI